MPYLVLSGKDAVVPDTQVQYDRVYAMNMHTGEYVDESKEVNKEGYLVFRGLPEGRYGVIYEQGEKRQWGATFNVVDSIRAVNPPWER